MPEGDGRGPPGEEFFIVCAASEDGRGGFAIGEAHSERAKAEAVIAAMSEEERASYYPYIEHYRYAADGYPTAVLPAPAEPSGEIPF